MTSSQVQNLAIYFENNVIEATLNELTSYKNLYHQSRELVAILIIILIASVAYNIYLFFLISCIQRLINLFRLST